MWIAVFAMLAGSLVIAEVGRRGTIGTLPRNHFAGIRVPSTMRDDETWEVAHRAAGPLLVAIGLGSAVLSIVAGAVGTSSGDAAAAAVILAGTVVLVVGTLLSARRAIRAAGTHSRQVTGDAGRRAV